MIYELTIICTSSTIRQEEVILTESQHNLTMICNNYFDHFISQDPKHNKSLTKFGYTCDSLGSPAENCAPVGFTGNVGFTGDYNKPVYNCQCACKQHTCIAYLKPSLNKLIISKLKLKID